MIDIDELVANSAQYRAAARTRQSLEVRGVVRVQLADTTAALDSAVAGSDPEKAARALEGYQRHLRDLGEQARVRAWTGTLLEREGEIDDPGLRFFLHELQYAFDFHAGDTASAMAHVEELFRIAEQMSEGEFAARAYVAVCRLDLRNEDGAALEEHAAKLLEHADAADDDYYRAFSHHMVANLREMQGDAAEATECYLKSAALFKQCGADYMVHTESFNLAACALDLDRLTEARKAFADVEVLSRELEETHLIPELLSCLSLLLLKEGDTAAAARLMGACRAALENQDRHLYPAEEKINADTAATLAQRLGGDAYQAELEQGRQLDPAGAFRLARLGGV